MSINYGFADSALTHVIGIDEVGWGAIAGPLYVGGCRVRIDDPLDWLDIKDSKKYNSEAARETAYYNLQRAQSLKLIDFFSWEAPVGQIEEDPMAALLLAQNIVCSTLLFRDSPGDAINAGIIVDGNNIHPELHALAHRTVPKADSLFKVVSAASVVAKVERDKVLKTLAVEYPLYQFDKNKGYPTKKHLDCLHANGPCCYHRKNIAQVAKHYAQTV